MLKDEKQKLKEQLSVLKGIKKIYPSDANFILFETADAGNVYQQLVTQKIIARNRHTVISNCIRVTVGKPEENEIFIKALKEILA